VLNFRKLQSVDIEEISHSGSQGQKKYNSSKDLICDRFAV